MNSRPIDRASGFTVLEIVIVLALVVFLFVAIPAFYRPGDTHLTTQTQILKAHIRYAQARAMNTDRPWGLHFDTLQRAYWLFKDGHDETKIPLPGQAADSVDLGGLNLDITGDAFNLTFDNWGKPHSDERTFSGGQMAISLNRSGTEGDAIIITENTGFIP